MILDISQEVFSSCVFPGDPAPAFIRLSSIREGAASNLTAFSMCAHNGTHVDAPKHFIDDGPAVDQVPLEAFVGLAYVADHTGPVEAADARRMLEMAAGCPRLLIRGKATVTAPAAEVFAAAGLLLIGNESQTFGTEDDPAPVHRILLGAGVILLEGVRLERAREGFWFLSAAPLNLAGSDGAPVRAWLMDPAELVRA